MPCYEQKSRWNFTDVLNKIIKIGAARVIFEMTLVTKICENLAER